jgi:LCP family protein required for cell wall assembly
LSGRDGDPELTDTMMLLQANFENGKIITLSFPRDLYLEDYQTKINALYFYGKEKYSNSPEQFPKEAIEKLGNLKIDYAIAIGIEDLEKLISIVDGVEIDVPTAFTDPLFPVQGVDVSKITDPKILYEQISFEKGLQKMDSSTALKYMRSRHSEDDQGTDDARAQRQQLVLQALANKLTTIRDPKVFGQLYRFYLDRFAKNISISELVKISTVFIDYLSKNEQNKISFEKHQLSIYPADKNGVIFNPPLWQSKQQWIYKIKDQTKFTESINAIFN